MFDQRCKIFIKRNSLCLSCSNRGRYMMDGEHMLTFWGSENNRVSQDQLKASGVKHCLSLNQVDLTPEDLHTHALVYFFLFQKPRHIDSKVQFEPLCFSAESWGGSWHRALIRGTSCSPSLLRAGRETTGSTPHISRLWSSSASSKHKQNVTF